MTAKAFAYLVKSGGLVGSGGEQLFIEADSQVDNSFTTTTFTVFTIYFPDTSSFGRDDELVCCAVFGG